MKAPWEKFSLPAADGSVYATGRSPEFVRTMREIFGPLVERVTKLPAGRHAWLMVEVPSEGSLSSFFADLEERLEPAGSLWVVFPKKPFVAELDFPYMVPVVIAPRKRTVLYLDAEGMPEAEARTLTDPVTLPDGRVVGARAAPAP